MKANRILIGFLAAGLLATGCTKQYITDEHIYYQGLDMTLIDFPGQGFQLEHLGSAFRQ